MGHLLSSVNPEAADRLQELRPLPIVGEMVVFCPRPVEIRAGRPRVPAIVLKADVDNRLLDILAIYDADDFASLQRLAQRQGDDERGWDYLTAAVGNVEELVGELDHFKAQLGKVVFGGQKKAETSIYDQLDDIRQRIDKLEGKAAKRRSAA